MSRPSAKLLAKAARIIDAAGGLLKQGHAEFAVGRAYYAMFYIAEALLAEKGLSFHKHSGVHSAFGEHFSKTGLLDKKYHKWLLEAFNERLTTDYGVDVIPGYDDAKEFIDQAEGFLQAAHRYLKKSE